MLELNLVLTFLQNSAGIFPPSILMTLQFVFICVVLDSNWNWFDVLKHKNVTNMQNNRKSWREWTLVHTTVLKRSESESTITEETYFVMNKVSIFIIKLNWKEISW